MKHAATVGRLLLALFVALAVGACAKKTVPVMDGAGAAAGAAGSGAAGTGPMGMTEEKWRELGLNTEAERQAFMRDSESFQNDDVLFDYDSYTLREDAKKKIDQKVAFMKRYAKVRVTIEGHCDERGTNEYNLALGERRAASVKQYMTNSGVAAERLTTVSYGEERPVATGHDEASWARNRRAHFVLNL